MSASSSRGVRRQRRHPNAREVSPILAGTSWFAATGGRVGNWDGDTWWLKTDDIWLELTDLQISDVESVSAVGHTIFFSSIEAMWVMSINTTD